jgi:hypothetical protein
VWTKVRQDAEAANERRARQERLEQKARSNTPLIQSVETPEYNLSLTSSLALSPLTGSKVFTPHHTLWRALILLFLTVLTHVRLPLDIGDRICEILGAWISLFVGPEYYFHSGLDGLSGDEAQRSMLGSVDDAIRAMETWNADLTWFIFERQRKDLQGSSSGVVEVKENDVLEIDGVVLQFAKVAF